MIILIGHGKNIHTCFSSFSDGCFNVLTFFAGKTLPSIVSSLVFQDATFSQHARAPWQPFLPEFQRLIDLLLGEIRPTVQCDPQNNEHSDGPMGMT